jgi:hypothetical protein
LEPPANPARFILTEKNFWFQRIDVDQSPHWTASRRYRRLARRQTSSARISASSMPAVLPAVGMSWNAVDLTFAVKRSVELGATPAPHNQGARTGLASGQDPHSETASELFVQHRPPVTSFLSDQIGDILPLNAKTYRKGIDKIVRTFTLRLR